MGWLLGGWLPHDGRIRGLYPRWSFSSPKDLGVGGWIGPLPFMAEILWAYYIGSDPKNLLHWEPILQVGDFKSRWWFDLFFNFHPYLGKISNLTNIFQMGWNHQLEILCNLHPPSSVGWNSFPPSKTGELLFPIREDHPSKRCCLACLVFQLEENFAWIIIWTWKTWCTIILGNCGWFRGKVDGN